MRRRRTYRRRNWRISSVIVLSFWASRDWVRSRANNLEGRSKIIIGETQNLNCLLTLLFNSFGASSSMSELSGTASYMVVPQNVLYYIATLSQLMYRTIRPIYATKRIRRRWGSVHSEFVLAPCRMWVVP